MGDKPIKERLEEFWGELFAENLKDYLEADEVTALKVASDPPDALYDISCKSGKKHRTWAEITNVYPSKGTAKHAFQGARAGLSDRPETHKAFDSEAKRALGGPSKTAGGALEDPDRQITQIAKEAILRKIRKTTYNGLCAKHGSGYLLLVIPYQTYPLVSSVTAEYIKSCLPLQHLDRQSNFCSVWVGYKQPDFEDGFRIVHLPASSSGYAFVRLWPDRGDSISVTMGPK